MTPEQLRKIRHVISDMRFMQAAALVASGLNENKQATAYMSKLARLAKLDKMLGEEIERNQHE